MKYLGSHSRVQGLALLFLIPLGALVVGAILCAIAADSDAGEIRELYRGTRAMAMGNAVVAVTEDEQAIFLNPAGLAGVRNLTFNYMSLDLTASTGTVAAGTGLASAFKNPSGGGLNSLMGKDISARAQLTPSLIMPNFGMALIVDGQVGLNIENQSLPQVELGYQTTNGIQVAYGTSVLGGGRRGRREQQDLRVGVGAKMLWRRGGYRHLSVLDLVSIDQNSFKRLAGPWGKGYGLDLGSQYIRVINPYVRLQAGIAYTDIGDTSIGDGPDPVKSDLAMSLAGVFGMQHGKFTLSVEQRHLTDQTDWRKKTHVGAELALPIVRVYGGINQVSLTYGAAVDFWLMSVAAASYAEEQGSFVHQTSSRRYNLNIGMKFSL